MQLIYVHQDLCLTDRQKLKFCEVTTLHVGLFRNLNLAHIQRPGTWYLLVQLSRLMVQDQQYSAGQSESQLLLLLFLLKPGITILALYPRLVYLKTILYSNMSKGSDSSNCQNKTNIRLIKFLIFYAYHQYSHITEHIQNQQVRLCLDKQPGNLSA